MDKEIRIYRWYLITLVLLLSPVIHSTIYSFAGLATAISRLDYIMFNQAAVYFLFYGVSLTLLALPVAVAVKTGGVVTTIGKYNGLYGLLFLVVSFGPSTASVVIPLNLTLIGISLVFYGVVFVMVGEALIIRRRRMYEPQRV